MSVAHSPARPSPTAAPPPAPAGDWDYRRRARRLRHVYAGQPAKLQQALGRLAAECDARTRAPRPDQRPAGPARVAVRRCPPAAAAAAAPAATQFFAALPSSAGRNAIDIARKFAGLVERQMTGGVLPYSRRVALLRVARKLGINRFEANLIIAAVQHREPTPPVGDGKCEEPPPRRGAMLWVTGLVVVGIESVVASALWWAAQA